VLVRFSDIDQVMAIEVRGVDLGDRRAQLAEQSVKGSSAGRSDRGGW
jgi:hypothetical protein